MRLDVESAGGPGGPSHPPASQMPPGLPGSPWPAVVRPVGCSPRDPCPVTRAGILGHPPWTGAGSGAPACSQRMSPGRASLGAGEREAAWAGPERQRTARPSVGARTHAAAALQLICFRSRAPSAPLPSRHRAPCALPLAVSSAGPRPDRGGGGARQALRRPPPTLRGLG